MDHHFIANTLCDLTRIYLWEPRINWARSRNPTAELVIQVGRGKATYVKHRRDLTGPLTLVFGQKMVASKANPHELCNWLGSKEIVRRGYYGGELNMLNALAHTAIHEFAHVVQVLLGVRYDGSSHSAEFYKILDRAHQSGEADRLRERLDAICQSRGYLLANYTPTERHLAILRGEPAINEDGTPLLTMKDVRVGQVYALPPDAAAKYGLLRVVDKKRTKVLAISLATGQMYRLPPSLLRVTSV